MDDGKCKENKLLKLFNFFGIYSALKAIDHVLRLCENHLSDGSEAAAHYRNVCRALVSEALELSSFLEKAWLKKNGDDGDFRQELQELALRDWVGTIRSLSFIIDFRLQL